LTTPVDAFPRGAGPFGTLDQAGNVWEWCEDVWNADAYWQREGTKDPVGNQGDSAVRCLRGGSWGVQARLLAAAYRFWSRGADRDRYVGFRCLLPVLLEP
jgi:formylglycine-generating enzyme required for sulfatase activity